MVRFKVVFGFTLLLCLSLADLAFAGLPRGIALSADEQIADETTGVLTARGSAEISDVAYGIAGSADVIEVRPKLNEIIFKGRVMLLVGKDRYQSDTVSCTLDFATCRAVAADQDLMPPTGSAETMPR